MNVQNIAVADFTQAYGILCAPLPSGNFRQALQPTFCRITMGLKTTVHSHFETELFYIIAGNGMMSIDGSSFLVAKGDLVRIPPFTSHELENTGLGDLDFLSIYSEDFEVPALPFKVIITAAPPTPNGPLHLGHISGPYLASDVVARYLRQKNSTVISHTGTDDHQNYVAARAGALGLETEDFREAMRKRIFTGLKNFRIEFDETIEPKKDPAYQERIHQFFQRAVDSNFIRLQSVAFPHCESCDHFLVDALVEGCCPECLGDSRGGCEACGLVVPPYELIDPACSRCKRKAGLRELSIYTFDLGKHLPLIEKDLEELALKPRIREMIARVSRRKELTVMLTHPDPAGNGIPHEQIGQSYHVWFEMAAHYEKFALGDDFWIHNFGFDNSFYYLLFIPALLRAMDAKAKLPDAVVTNEFLELEGLKFSTSRNHAIWADEFTGNNDHLRLYLLINRPDSMSDNFSAKDFTTFSEDLDRRLKKLSDFSLQANKGTSLTTHRMNREMDALLHPTQLDLRRAARLLHHYLQADARDDFSKVALAGLMSPFMPGEATKLMENIGGTV
ncbi:MAG TPA: class I tRNA ligase family protein [Bacteriovoracaceae bacterium]|nr:class I tRNA ligase family protein [Bacteriovoracaceae bacterium]